MSEQQDKFLYPIGAVLTHKALLVEPQEHDPARLFVIERMEQSCPGGVQRHYSCRVVHARGTRDVQIERELRTFNEVELAPLPERDMGQRMQDLLSRIRTWSRDVRELLDRYEEEERGDKKQ